MQNNRERRSRRRNWEEDEEDEEWELEGSSKTPWKSYLSLIWSSASSSIRGGNIIRSIRDNTRNHSHNNNNGLFIQPDSRYI